MMNMLMTGITILLSNDKQVHNVCPETDLNISGSKGLYSVLEKCVYMQRIS